MLCGLESETYQVVSLQERLSVICTASQGLQIKSGEGVDFAGIAADVEELRVLQGGGEQVGLEIGDGVFVTDGALVPVVWDFFPAFGPLEVSGGACNGEEGLENVLVQDALVYALIYCMMERLVRPRWGLTSGCSADLLAIKR